MVALGAQGGKCLDANCYLWDQLRGCKLRGSCRRGHFVTMVRREFSDLGDWHFREFASGAMVATLKGKAGRVEIWGANHRPEVYYVAKRTKDKDIPPDDRDLRGMDALTVAVYDACAQAAIQGRLEV